MKRFAPVTFLLIFVFGCLLCWSGSAQAYELGGFDWSPTISLDETYDSNIAFAHTDTKSDFITAIAPGIEGVFDGKNRSAKIKGTLHQKLYASHSDFNNFSQDFAGSFKQEFSKYDRLALTDSFLHADQSSSFDDEFGKSSGRYDFYKNLFGASYAHDFSSQLTGSLKYTNEYYSPDLDALAKSVANTFGVQTDYAVSSQTIPFWFYEHAQRSFDPGDTISRNSTGVGAKHFLTEQLYVNGKIGADFIDPIGSDSIVRPQYLIGIADQTDETTVYGATYTRHYEDSSYDQNLLNSWRFSLNWGKQLLERLNGVLSAFTGGGKFEPDGSKERLDGVGLALHYDVTKDSILSAGVTFSKKNSSDLTRDYEKNTVSLNWKTKF